MTTDTLHALCTDLGDEVASLDGILAAIDDAAWSAPTPAPGWSVRDQLAHLWFFDERARLALVDEAAFAADAASLFASGDPSLERAAGMTTIELLTAWREASAALVGAARDIEPARRVPWYGPSMSARSFITARLMEAWAHGQDIVDALEVSRPPTHRLRHVAHIGVGARPYAYRVHRMTMPDVPVRVELAAPDGGTWTWGDDDASASISGAALDFCLVVTQRRHPADVALEARGDAATEWLSIAQAFAGPPGAGRLPGQFSR